MQLSIDIRCEQDVCRIGVAGEVDVSCADELRAAVDEAFAGSASTIEVDLAEVPYIDSTGIGVLVGFSHRATAARLAFGISNVQPGVLRVLRLLGVEDELHARAD